jgi:hypothetical protein
VKNVSSGFVTIGKGLPGGAQTAHDLIYPVYPNNVDRPFRSPDSEANTKVPSGLDLVLQARFPSYFEYDIIRMALRETPGEKLS